MAACMAVVIPVPEPEPVPVPVLEPGIGPVIDIAGNGGGGRL